VYTRNLIEFYRGHDDRVGHCFTCHQQGGEGACRKLSDSGHAHVASATHTSLNSANLSLTRCLLIRFTRLNPVTAPKVEYARDLRRCFQLGATDDLFAAMHPPGGGINLLMYVDVNGQ
jgi:hypothetical protein